MLFPISEVRSKFPSLSLLDGDRARAYLDNPAGTQVPESVANAVCQYMLTTASNAGGHFGASVETDRITLQAHEEVLSDKMSLRRGGLFRSLSV